MAAVVFVDDGRYNNKGSETGTSFRRALYFKEIGFNLHDTMIYEKHNPVPKRKQQVSTELWFMFVLKVKVNRKQQIFYLRKVTNVMTNTESRLLIEIRTGNKRQNTKLYKRICSKAEYMEI